MAIYGGIDLGGTKIQAAVVDEGNDHAVLGAKRDQTPLKGGPKAIAARMAAVLVESLEEAGLSVSDLDGVGVGSPGSVDDQKGTVAGAMNLSDWAGSFNLRRVLEKEFGGAPVALGNDVDLATDAEFEIGAAKQYDSLLGVFWGTGVGGGLILDGKPWVGRKTAGEIGHMVVRLNGAHCPCGRRGCMEAYAGRGAMEARARKRVNQGEKTSLFRIMEERGRDRLSSGIWERALARDDHMAIDLLEEAVEALGAGVASAVNLLDPEAVVIGGGLGIRLGEPWVQRIREAMHPHLFVDTDPPPVMLAELGDLGGAHGGALLAARRAAVA
ncbi:ROK family protein [Solirubrobacter ginsenosidimutans]|uniref:ROK family protein n=1 Tax=Solirubrobacter ginsenosidimutans TaxID=490573 RepID=A0A9X3S7U3_9ACTN|nr:ROK family protein [Solirubrobacter ginsenosidimutans]MDA0166366.1 ROK family protein [Solirubrobacter ginsenosidimutans]